jgi:hypothetical protein
MRNALIAATAAFLLVWSGSDAAAQQWIQKTAADSVLIEGVAYPRATFTAWDRHPTRGFDHVIAYRLASTGPADTCRAIQAVAPPGWTAYLATDVVIWWKMDGGGVIPGESVSGLQLVLTPGYSPCFFFDFENAVEDSAGTETDCFGPDQPVPVKARTWGALKARYR